MNRKGFIAGSALLAAASGAANAENVPGGTHFVERRGDFDAASFDTTLGRPAEIRQLYEAVAFRPSLLNNVKNSLNGLQFGFGYAPETIALALAGHGPSAVYGYADPIWARYRLGEFFKLVDAGGTPVASNVFLRQRAKLDREANPDDAAGMYQDASIEMLAHRGLVVLTCHTAVEEQAKAIVARGFAPLSMAAKDVADDILTNLIAGAIVVPSMVAAVAVLQSRYRYTYISLEL